MKAIYIGIVLLAGVILAGCSGGGSSGTTATSTQSASKVSITATNEGAVTKSAISAATQSLGVSNLSSVGGVQTTTDSSNDRILFNAADFALQQMAQQQNTPASVIGAVTTTACTVSGNVVEDTDGTSTTATYYKATFNSCVYTAGTTYNGTIFITGVSRTPASGTATGLTATLDFNFSVVSNGSTVSLVGGFTIAASGMGSAARTDSLTGTSLAVSAGTQSFSLTNFSFKSAYNDSIATPTFYTDNINYTLTFADSATPANNMTFSCATTASQPIVKYTGEAYPRSGQFVVSGGGTTALRVTILTGTGAGTSSGSLTLELSNDSGTTWGTPKSYTWATL